MAWFRTICAAMNSSAHYKASASEDTNKPQEDKHIHVLGRMWTAESRVQTAHSSKLS